MTSLIVCTSGIDAGSVSRLPEWVFMPSAGTASDGHDGAAEQQRDNRVAEHRAEQPAADAPAARCRGG